MNPGLFKLTIPKPCTQDWNSMHQTERGRHCLHCRKEVTDFTAMHDEEVQNFLKQNKVQGCGRFKSTQLERISIYIPNYIFQKPIPAWKKYLAILLICFARDIFPVNIILGSPGSLYAQTINQKSNVHQQGKKRFRHRKRFSYIEMPYITDTFETVVMGNIIPVDPAPGPGKDFLIITGISIDESPDTGNKYPRNMIAMRGKNKQPEKQKRKEETVFILPDALTNKRRIS